jgi:hypothetical protein
MQSLHTTHPSGTQTPSPGWARRAKRIIFSASTRRWNESVEPRPSPVPLTHCTNSWTPVSMMDTSPLLMRSPPHKYGTNLAWSSSPTWKPPKSPFDSFWPPSPCLTPKSPPPYPFTAAWHDCCSTLWVQSVPTPGEGRPGAVRCQTRRSARQGPARPAGRAYKDTGLQTEVYYSHLKDRTAN